MQLSYSFTCICLIYAQLLYQYNLGDAQVNIVVSGFFTVPNNVCFLINSMGDIAAVIPIVSKTAAIASVTTISVTNVPFHVSHLFVLCSINICTT